MREEGLQARARKRFKVTTMSDHDQPVAANRGRLDEDFIHNVRSQLPIRGKYLDHHGSVEALGGRFSGINTPIYFLVVGVHVRPVSLLVFRDHDPWLIVVVVLKTFENQHRGRLGLRLHGAPL